MSMYKAVEVLCRMRGMSHLSATAFAEQCQPEELEAIGTAKSGTHLQEVLGVIADRTTAERLAAEETVKAEDALRLEEEEQPE